MLSTAMIAVSPRSLSALTRLAPMNPAAPVTTMYTQLSFSRKRRSACPRSVRRFALQHSDRHAREVIGQGTTRLHPSQELSPLFNPQRVAMSRCAVDVRILNAQCSQLEIELSDFRYDKSHPRRNRTQQLITDGTRSAGHFINTQGFAPEHDRA